MILVVNVCAEKLHYYEFVKPVLDVLRNEEILVRHYRDLSDKDLAKCDKVIICGTSLRDDEFLEDLRKFDWLNDFDKPVLGICAGMQIIGLVFDGKLKKHLEIGYFYEEFVKDFLGLKGKVQVFHLHNNSIDFGEEFESFVDSKIAQAVKHFEKEIYGVLFHPEVRQKEMILEFVRL